MAHALSEDSTRNLYEKGHKIFRNNFEDSMVSLPLVDFEKALSNPEPREFIQNLAPQDLYYSLKQKGPGNALEVLPHLSPEQFTKIADYDAWQADELVTKKLFTWLDLYKKIEPREMVNRYRQLDEEYQVAALAPYVRAYTEEEYEKMSEAEQDSLFAFPGKELYFSVVGLDKDTHESVIHFFEIAGEQDIDYAASLLAELTFNPPHEVHELIAQFRKARLEEDGFVSAEEAQSFFRRLDFKAMEKECETLRQKAEEGLSQSSQNFLKEVLEFCATSSYSDKVSSVHRSFLLLANALTEITGVEVGDLTELKQLMRTAHAYVSFALEVLTRGDKKLAAELLTSKYHVKDLFRFTLSFFHEKKTLFLKEIEEDGILSTTKLREDLDTLRYGSLLDRLDKEFLEPFGFEGTEVIKAFLGRFSFYPLVENKTFAKDSLAALCFAPISSVKDLEQLSLYLNQIKTLASAHQS